MQTQFETLREMARLAVQAPATTDNLVLVADVLRDALDAAAVHFTYAADKDFLVCGDSCSGDDIGTSQIGLWLVRHQFEVLEDPVAFNIRARRVEDFTSAVGAKGRAYLAFRVPISESPAEMLIMRGPWENGLNAQVLKYVETALPSLTLFLERMLNAGRESRLREHMAALANATDLLTRAEEVETALDNISTAVAGVSGYDIAAIDLYDETFQKNLMRGYNISRFSGLSLIQEWNEMLKSTPTAPVRLECLRTRQPMLTPDLQNDERIPEINRMWFRRTLMTSGADIPLTFGDEVFGVLSVASFKPRTFPPEEVEFLEGLAAQVALALKAMQMYRALAESEKQLKEYSEQLRKRMEIQHRLARTDALTGIPNRRYAEEVIEGECARAERQKRKLSVAMVDVDGLKGVNDGYGHDAGDEVLIRLAQIARWSCRRGDTVGRYGGDEFVFVLPEAGLRAAWRFSERFRSRVEKEKIRLSGRKTVGVSVSLGVAEYQKGDSETPTELIERADSALYEAKSLGGNTTCPRIPAERAA
jgi:diguanylate cyclase (GGDEF)-like protein